MPFIAANGLTEEETSKTVQVGGVNVHFHDIGQGEPIIFFHSYGPGITAWINWHKVAGALAQHYRCILFDMPNFAKSGPLIFEDSVHAFHVGVATQLLDALGIDDAFWVGNSMGGQCCLVAAIEHPERVKKIVLGGNHLGTGDRYVFANRPSEAMRVTRSLSSEPSKEEIRRFLEVHIDDQALVIDELVDYLHHWHTRSPELAEARAKSKMVVVDYTEGATAIQAPALLIHGRDDRMILSRKASTSSTTSPTRECFSSRIAATGLPSKSRKSTLLTSSLSCRSELGGLKVGASPAGPESAHRSAMISAL